MNFELILLIVAVLIVIGIIKKIMKLVCFAAVVGLIFMLYQYLTSAQSWAGFVFINI